MPDARQPSPWTFETLAAVDRAELNEVLRTGTAPDPEQLNGYSYCGWNHDFLGKLTGEKFKKGFHEKDGRNFGYNELVHQDKDDYRGEWKVKLKHGRPRQLGYFRVSLVKDEPSQKLHRPHLHLGLFDYNVAANTGASYPLRAIRDFVALPNPGDHSLILGKAYLQLGGSALNVFYSYFVLGHRRQIEHAPRQP